MTPLVRRTEQAELDLEEILAYFDDRSPAAADRFARTFRRKTETLARMPEMGRSREELAPGLRSLAAGRHIIFYQPAEDGIVVIRVAHGSRDLPALFE